MQIRDTLFAHLYYPLKATKKIRDNQEIADTLAI
jgi:hypothetical protein